MIEKGRLSRWHPKERQGEGGRIAQGNQYHAIDCIRCRLFLNPIDLPLEAFL